VWWDDTSRFLKAGQTFPVGFGPYRITGDSASGITDVLGRRKLVDLPLHGAFVDTPTVIGSYLIGRHGAAVGRSTPYPRMRADRKALEAFGVIDLSEVRNPRLLSSRNVLGFTNPPVDHVIQEYLGAWDPMTLAGCYHGSASYFGTDMSGIVGHGDRIYIQSAAFLYAIGPAVKGTPKDDPQVVAAIRAGNDLAKYLDSDSAQYRYEAVLKTTADAPALRRLATEDPYEEIRAEALRKLGLAAGKPGFAALRELVIKDIVLPPGDSNAYTGSGDTVLTLIQLGADADVVLLSLLTDPDAKIRRNGAAAAGLWPRGSATVRDALLPMAADRSSEQATRTYAIAAATALANWPADPSVTGLFQKLIANEKEWGFHGSAVAYLMRVLPEDQKNAVLVAACRGHNGSRFVPVLLERDALNDLRSLVTTTKDRIQVGVISTLCQTAFYGTKPAWKTFAAEMGTLALREPSKDLQALSGIVNAIKTLGADAAPVLPLLKALKIEDAATAKTITDAIAEIEAKVAAAAEKK
jgi:hypothetical protein